jgi:hypothetical protein
MSNSLREFPQNESEKLRISLAETSADQAVCLMAEDGEPVAGRPGA